MNTIALTGHPMAQDAVHLQLQALIGQQRLPIRVLAGLCTPEEAAAIYAEGGEVWHCGTDAPASALAPHIDRKLPASTFEALCPLVASCLAQHNSKTHITGGTHG